MNYLFKVRGPVVEGLEEEATGHAEFQGQLDHCPSFLLNCSEKQCRSHKTEVTESKRNHFRGSGQHSEQPPILVWVQIITEPRLARSLQILNVSYNHHHWTVLVRVRRETKLQNNQKICRLIIRPDSADYKK